MRNYKSLESHFIPAGVFSDVEDFKNKIESEFYDMMENKKKLIQETDDENIPLPIGLYVLYKDMSARRTLIFPQSATEKKAMVMALKKQVRAKNMINGQPACTEPIYGAFISEIWVSSFKMPEGPKGEEATPEEKAKAIEEFQKLFKQNKVERETRAVIQFEDAVTHEYDCRMFKIIDPCIPVYDEAESKEMSEALTKMSAQGDEHGMMNSIFDYSEEQELDVLGKGGMNVDYFSLRDAISFVQNSLKDNTQSAEGI